jgi:hypothetical protein
MRRLRVGSKFVLVMLLTMSGLRIGVGRCGMTLRGRRIGIAVLVVLMMVSRLLVGDRMVASILVLVVLFMIGSRERKGSQRSLLRHRRETDVLVGHFCLQSNDVVSQSQVLVLKGLAVLLHGQSALQVILQLVDVLFLAQTEGALGGTVLSSALCVRKLAVGSSLLASSSSLGVGVIGGVGMRGWQIGALVCHAVWLDGHDRVVVMVQRLLVRLVGWVGVGRSSMLVGLVWLRRGMVVLSGDELVAQTWTRSRSVSDRGAYDEGPAYSSQRLASPGHSVSNASSWAHNTRVDQDSQQPKTWS